MSQTLTHVTGISQTIPSPYAMNIFVIVCLAVGIALFVAAAVLQWEKILNHETSKPTKQHPRSFEIGATNA